MITMSGLAFSICRIIKHLRSPVRSLPPAQNSWRLVSIDMSEEIEPSNPLKPIEIDWRLVAVYNSLGMWPGGKLLRGMCNWN
jgi:hypothetical protein